MIHPASHDDGPGISNSTPHPRGWGSEFGLLWRKLSACSVEPRLDVGTGLGFLELSFLEWVWGEAKAHTERTNAAKAGGPFTGLVRRSRILGRPFTAGWARAQLAVPQPASSGLPVCVPSMFDSLGVKVPLTT